MTARRVMACIAAIATVSILQAMLIAPWTAPLAVSLPAVFVAAVGIEAGASAGLAVGFTAGLLADLGSRHPAGILALTWLLLGVFCGLLANSRRRRLTSALLVAVTAGLASFVVVVVLGLFGTPSNSLAGDLGLAAPTVLGDAVLALVVVAPLRAALRALRVRLPSMQPQSDSIVRTRASAAGVPVSPVQDTVNA
jgi:rod shape-determining protein MreD